MIVQQSPASAAAGKEACGTSANAAPVSPGGLYKPRFEITLETSSTASSSSTRPERPTLPCAEETLGREEIGDA